MKSIVYWVILSTLLVCGRVFAAGEQAFSPELQKLAVSVGQWRFRGVSLGTRFSKPGKWTWHEDCGWSASRVFLLCSFTNDWSGKIVKSLVVDTYNSVDHAYWHYEIFAVGASGGHPFVSRMTVHGNTWIEYGRDQEHGKKISERIVYHFTSPVRVSVQIDISRDGVHWITVDRGEGMKLPDMQAGGAKTPFFCG